MINEIKNESHRKFLSNIVSSGKTLLNLINAILDLSKIEAGRLELQLHPVRLQIVADEIVQMFSWKIQEKDLAFRVEIDPSIPDAVFIDEVRLRQILVNLVGNAVKFTEKGYIRMAIQNLPRHPLLKDELIDLQFSVEDTGIGIAENQQQIIFESFRQHAGQDNARYGGTGLGLAITKRLVEMMLFLAYEVESETYKFEKSLDVNLSLTGDDVKHLEKEKIAELMDELNGPLMTYWKKISKTLIINRVEEFASMIEKLGERYTLENVKQWGTILMQLASEFDIERLNYFLGKYPQLIDKLVNEAEKKSNWFR